MFSLLHVRLFRALIKINQSINQSKSGDISSIWRICMINKLDEYARYEVYTRLGLFVGMKEEG